MVISTMHGSMNVKSYENIWVSFFGGGIEIEEFVE